MKRRRNYTEESQKLAIAIEIAIEAFQLNWPQNLEPSHQENFISCYAQWKAQCLNPPVAVKNLNALMHLEHDVFAYFQERTGAAVEYFWKKIKEHALDYRRENKLEKILHRGKILGRVEFDYVNEMILIAEEIGFTSRQETRKLSELLQDYTKMQTNRRKRKF
ncbi:hypothetical protein [Persicobacter diffluens]|uniref:Uncharacterized protein n=1 Tax=Persicobacter diffluens TaxID=981 RepID=A0AAN4W1Q3_9BACT|nr:hypothetical protein PEDI_38110 [Persicobacter diffluens]